MDVDERLFKYVVTEESYPDKSVIIEEGSRGDWIYLILEGRVKVRKRTSRGNMVVSTLKAGSFFGELIFLQEGRGERTASIAADGPVTVGLLDMNRIGREFQSVSPLLQQLLAVLARRLQHSTARLAELSLPDRTD